MHTSAQHVDLNLDCSGMLTADAQVRTRIDPAGRSIPVIRIELQHQHHAAVHHIVLEQPYPANQYEQAQHAAKQLTRGRCITFDSTTADVRIVFPNVTAINIL